MVYRNFDEFIRTVVECRRCERLVRFRVEVASKRAKFSGHDFWSKPVPGFGDINGRMLILGLAPAATGGNRTGRVFTGDKSSDFLVDCLHEVEITNQSESVSTDDGLEYRDAYITAVLKCVPPNDKPLPEEIKACSDYLTYEIDTMKNLKVVLTLGTVAHTGFNRYMRARGYDVRGRKFINGQVYDYGDFVEVCCYHPSPRNVNTGRLTREGFIAVLRKAKDLTHQ